MKYILPPLKFLFFVSCYLSSYSIHAFDSKAIEKQANVSINELYHTLHGMPNTSMVERIDWFSAHFLGVKYILGSLGEGADARYDQYPLYRVDGFDCDTYVNTVLALALANSLPSFQQCLRQTRYKNGKVAYLLRNHFTSIDWNKNNEVRGMLKDITLTITDQQKHPVAVMANALIDKPGWYAHKQLNTIRLEKDNAQEQEKRLLELQAKGKHLPVTKSTVPYLPFTALFNAKQEPNLYLFDQIPNSAIIEIIRPGWDLRKQIGTALNISHLGFAVRVKNQLYFRSASSTHGKVIDIPLVDYLREALKSPTIKGISVLVVVPGKAVDGDCHGFIIK